MFVVIAIAFFCFTASLPIQELSRNSKLLSPVNSIVDQDHTGHGQPESEKRGEDGVGDVWVEDTFRNAAHLFNVRLPGPGRCNADKSPK